MKSIIQTDGDYCFFCHGIATDLHHCIGGSNRKLADQDGLTVRLCRLCHNKVHNGPTSKPLTEKLHRLAQTKWEESYQGDGKPREEFMKRYGRNYL